MLPSQSSLTTKRLRLRTVCRDDAPGLRALMSPSISRWVAAWPCPLEIETVERIVNGTLARVDAGQALAMVILERDTESLLGWIKLDVSRDGDRREAELGYWVAEHAQGRGTAFEAARAVIDAAFDRIDIDAVEAGAQTANAASHHLLAKLGMHQIGERIVHAPARGRDEPCLYWRVDRSAWRPGDSRTDITARCRDGS